MLCSPYMGAISHKLEYDNIEIKTLRNLLFSYFKSLGAESMGAIVSACAQKSVHENFRNKRSKIVL